MTSTRTATTTSRAAQPGVRIAAALAGALAVAAAAQVSFPLPGTPVPFTLQPLAVLIVGGLLGPRLGALSMVTYLGMGALGLPVFTPGALPGLARLFGPTGGYLLAYPVAAALVGKAVRRYADQAVRRYGDGAVSDTAPVAGVGTKAGPFLTALPPYRLTALSCLAGMLVIHAGGLSQLLILTGSVTAAFAAGVLPFVGHDLIKVLVAALAIRRFLPSTRALS